MAIPWCEIVHPEHFCLALAREMERNVQVNLLRMTHSNVTRGTKPHSHYEVMRIHLEQTGRKGNEGKHSKTHFWPSRFRRRNVATSFTDRHTDGHTKRRSSRLQSIGANIFLFVFRKRQPFIKFTSTLYTNIQSNNPIEAAGE